MNNMPIIQTNHVQYTNCNIQAFDYTAPTTAVRFQDKDGNDLGFVINTNADGMMSVAQQSLDGVFVPVKSIIRVFDTNNTQVAQWVVDYGGAGSSVNDGKLLNKNGDIVWSANNPNDYTLNIHDIDMSDSFGNNFMWGSYNYDLAQWDENNIAQYGIQDVIRPAAGSTTDGIRVALYLPPNCTHFDIMDNTPTGCLIDGSCNSILHLFVSVTTPGIHTTIFNNRPGPCFVYDGRWWTNGPDWQESATNAPEKGQQSAMMSGYSMSMIIGRTTSDNQTRTAMLGNMDSLAGVNWTVDTVQPVAYRNITAPVPAGTYATGVTIALRPNQTNA